MMTIKYQYFNATLYVRDVLLSICLLTSDYLY